MNAEVQQIGPCKKLLKIEIPAAAIKERLDKELRELQSTAQLPGFRRGRAPVSLIQKRYGEQVSGEVKASLMTESFETALKDNGLTPVGEPEFPEKLPEIEEGKPLAFEVKVEVAPVVDLPGYKKLKVKKPVIEVSEKEVETAIASLRRSDARQVPVESGPVEKNHVVVCGLEFRSEGKSLWSQPSVGLQVSGDSVGPFKVGDLDKLLEGARVGDTRTAATQFPDNASDEKLRGKPGELAVTVREIKRLELPEITDQWVKDRFQLDSLDQLKERLRKDIEHHKDLESLRAMRRVLADQLLEKASFDMPEGLLAREAQRARVRYRMQLLYEGLPPQEIEKEVEKITPASEEWAARSLKRYFVLREIAKKEGLLATENDVASWIQVIARNRGMTPAALKKQLETENQMDALRLQIVESKALTFLMEHAEVEEAKPEPKPDK